MLDLIEAYLPAVLQQHHIFQTQVLVFKKWLAWKEASLFVTDEVWGLYLGHTCQAVLAVFLLS